MTKREFDRVTKVNLRDRLMSASQYRRDVRCHVPAWIVDPLARRRSGWLELASLLRAYPKNSRVRTRIQDLSYA